MSDFAIFFLRPWLGAGSTTFAAHLFAGLEKAGAKPMIYRIAAKGVEAYAKEFGEYAGVSYKIVDLQTAKRVASSQPSVMASRMGAPFVPDDAVAALAKAGTRAVIHDSDELTTWDWSMFERPICVRKAVASLVPGSVWVPHPYVRQNSKEPAERKGSCSVARVSPKKRTSILLDANRLLGAADRIEILGMEKPKYAAQLARDYKGLFVNARSAVKFPLRFDAPVAQCMGHAFHADMSHFERDGGGTQYAQLEAADAGCVNVMHADWFRFDGDVRAGVNALAVADAAALAKAVTGPPQEDLVQGGYDLLAAHDAAAVAKIYLSEVRA